MGQNFFDSIVSVFFAAGGKGLIGGSKNLALNGLRKIGWAKQEDQQQSRLKGHSIGGHSLGGGKKAIPQQLPFQQKKQKSKPKKLFGRSTFQGADTLNGDSKDRWVRNKGNSKSFTPKPRSFIKF